MGEARFKYRPDIDGLRAIAVLAVVLYHYGIGGLHGGFVGVDVFFVISGYLITGIIHSEMKCGEFTLARFYERRARRIFPALFAMLLATMVAGLWILLPSDLVWLGKASMATVLFVSNVLYMLNSGYFDSTSDFNPLLHTWSLGVEEQFYLGLPLLLLLVGRFWTRGLVWVLAFCALASFVACVLIQPIVAKAVFFLSPFRAWELLLGSLLGIGAVPAIRHKAVSDVIAMLALAALLGSIAFMREGIDFPGWKAAIPVLATACLLHAGTGAGSRVNQLLAWKPLVFVGLISYSLYLWHWPLLVLAKYRMGMQPLSPMASLALFAVALLLAVASYYAVERPFRKKRRDGVDVPISRVFVVSGVAAIALCATGVSFAKEKGFPWRVTDSVAEMDRIRGEIPFVKCNKVLPGSRQDCRIGILGNGRPTALIWGDSHAMAWAPGMDEVLREQQWIGMLAVNSVCAPLLGLRNPKNRDCYQYNNGVIEWIERNRPDRVYLIAAWFAWSNQGEGYDLVDAVSGEKGNERIFGPAFGRTIERLRPWVKDIVAIGPTPGAAEAALPYRLAMVEWKHDAYPQGVFVKDEDYRRRASGFWHGVQPYAGKATLVDPEPWFCGNGRCRYSDGGKLLYRDGHHLSIAGARFAARHLAEMDGLRMAGKAVKAH